LEAVFSPCVLAGGAAGFDAAMLSDIFTDIISNGGGPPTTPVSRVGGVGGNPPPPKKEVKEDN
jgi:hypothetical protein